MLRNTSRYTSAILIGAAVTFGLLFVMQYMIASGQGGIDDQGAYRIVDFVRVDRKEIVEKKEKKPDPPPEPEPMPKMPEPLISTAVAPITIAMQRPQVTMSTGMNGLGFAMSDGEYLPIIKPPPQYPPRAAQNGIEGYVLVEYTVTETGTVTDVFIVESSDKVFERAALESAKRYKYTPRMVDGTPISVTGVQTRIEFHLED